MSKSTASIELDTSKLWFPEPPTTDLSAKYHLEGTLGYLRRSTNERAVACRSFLNENFQSVPAQLQDYLQRVTEDRFNSAYFELVVARFLQESGASLEIERSTMTGRRPDFLCQFPTGAAVIEAVSPVFNSEIVEAFSHNQRLLAILEEHIPPEWSVFVWQLPHIGPGDSTKWYKQLLRLHLTLPVPTTESQIESIHINTESGELELLLLPRKGEAAILGGPGVSGADDSTIRVRRAYRKKREQLRNTDYPVLLAINAPGIGTHDDDVDAALIGQTVCVMGADHTEISRHFRRSGEFYRGSSEAPTIAGVLIFRTALFVLPQEPVFYPHPRFVGRFPTPIEQLRTRKLIGETVVDMPATIPPVLSHIGFADQRLGHRTI